MLSDWCESVAITDGENGSLLSFNGEVTRIAPEKVCPVDTTGAGDLYAAGFLYGLIQGQSLESCGETGSILAGKTIEVIGPKMSEKQWNAVKDRIATV